LLRILNYLKFVNYLIQTHSKHLFIVEKQPNIQKVAIQTFISCNHYFYFNVSMSIFCLAKHIVITTGVSCLSIGCTSKTLEGIMIVDTHTAWEGSFGGECHDFILSNMIWIMLVTTNNIRDYVMTCHFTLFLVVVDYHLTQHVRKTADKCTNFLTILLQWFEWKIGDF